MRHFIFDIIKPEEGQTLDNLGQLFNAYAGRLSYLESSALPRNSMREYNRLFAQQAPDLSEQEKQEASNLLFLIPEFYHLQLLNNSLHALHRDVLGAIEKLTNCFNLYGDDLHRYAVENRLSSIDEYGSEDESDWYRDNEADESEPWKVTRKDDAESLKSYTLRADLAQFFESTADWHGEHIGSSEAEDFARFTRVVTAKSQMNPFKMIAQFTGHELPIYTMGEGGEMVPQTDAGRLESEINEEIRDVRVAHYFEQVMQRLTVAAGIFQGCQADNAAGLRQLLGQLEWVRDCAALTEPRHPFND